MAGVATIAFLDCTLISHTNTHTHTYTGALRNCVCVRMGITSRINGAIIKQLRHTHIGTHTYVEMAL